MLRNKKKGLEEQPFVRANVATSQRMIMEGMEKAQEEKGQDGAEGEKKEGEIDIKGPEGQP